MSRHSANQNDWPIHLNNVGLRFGNRVLFDHLNLTIQPLGITVLLGPNGVGKTNLLRLMMGLVAPSSGAIVWGNTEKPCGRFAYVPSRQQPFRRSARNNLRLALKLAGRTGHDAESAIENALSQCSLTHCADQPALELSSGECQKLFLAQAIALDCDTLFLDEPTSHLDPDSSDSIEQIIRDLQADDVQIVMISHDYEQAARLANQVLRLSPHSPPKISTAGQFFHREKTV